MSYSQEKRYIQLSTPLSDEIVMRGFQGREQISRLFKFSVEFAKMGSPLDESKLIRQLVGKNVTWQLETPDGKPRFFNGFVSRMSVSYNQDFGQFYRAEVVPWLWFLTQTSDCRVFQDMETPEIIRKIFDDLGFQDYAFNLKGQPKKWTYCVQYRETDFNFVSRLMEEEGIYYYFRHEDGKHTLHIADGPQGYFTLPEATVSYPLSRASTGHHQDVLLSWDRQIDFVAGKWAQTDYNFESPSTDLMSNENTRLKLPEAKKYEYYDYPGEFVEASVGTRQTKLRMEETEAQHNQVFATSSCKSFSCGGKFTVAESHPCGEELGKEYVITELNHAAVESTSGQSEGAEYQNNFACIASDIFYRPQRRTPKPLIHGLQPAVVVGPKGEEIYTDKYGRVKVQFFWDRVGKKDERSSCWIRCVQRVAGKKWGHMAIPRIGQEVLVEFIEGDPDRPVIIGGVYNAEQMPHYDPNEMATRTYIKTNSTKGGDGFNELFFDDKADAERVFLHAQKDLDVRVRNDSRERILGNRSQIIGHDKPPEESMGGGERGGYQYEKVFGDKHQRVKGTHHYLVEGSQYLYVGGDSKAAEPGAQHIQVERTQRLRVGYDGRHIIVDGSNLSQIGGEYGLTVSKDLRTKTGADYHLTVQSNICVKSDSAYQSAASSYHVKAGLDIAFEGGLTVYGKAGTDMVLEAGTSLTLQVGGNFINISPAGVAIQGAMVLINSGGAPGAPGNCSITEPSPPKEPSPTTAAKPNEPVEAHDEKTGYKSAPD